MNIFKSLFVPNGQKESITAYETWVVRWKSRHGCFSSDTKPECELFKTEEDANKFANQLREAFKLIKHTSGNSVTVEPNK